MLTLKQFYLLKLMEECSEVAQSAAKMMQFGDDATSPSTDKTYDNRLLTRGEINDLLAVLDVLTELGHIPEISPWELQAAKKAKREKMLIYLKHSQELGTVASWIEGQHLLLNWPLRCNLHGRKWIVFKDAAHTIPYCAMCTGAETKEGAEERQRLGRNKICGCREYPEYGDACLSEPNHRGPHDWQKK